MLGYLQEILALLGRLLGIASQLATVLGIVQGNTNKAAQENSPFEIDTATQEILAIVSDSTFGNSALQGLLLTLRDTLDADFAALSLQIGSPQQVTEPVTLPTTPPPGYGGSTPSDIWGEMDPVNGVSYGVDLQYAGRGAWHFGNFTAPLFEGNQWFVYQPWSVGSFTGIFADNPPSPAWTPDQGDVAGTLLDAVSGALLSGWTANWNSFVGGKVDVFAPEGYLYTTVFDDETWHLWRAGGGGGTLEANLPPIWPGLAKVTYHDDTAVTMPLTVIDVPMDGIEIALDTVAAKAAFYDFGHRKSFKALGLVAFYSDDNHTYEAAQPFGFQVALVTPRTMKRAAGVSVLFFQDCTGFVYPVDFAT